MFRLLIVQSKTKVLKARYLNNFLTMSELSFLFLLLLVSELSLSMKMDEKIRTAELLQRICPETPICRNNVTVSTQSDHTSCCTGKRSLVTYDVIYLFIGLVICFNIFFSIESLSQ